MNPTDQPDNSSAPPQDGSGVLAGRDVAMDSDAVRAAVADQAFDFRGDVTLELASGETVNGYVYDRRLDAQPPTLRVMLPPEKDAIRGAKVDVPLDEVQRLTFSSKDPAAGKSWEAWLRRYVEKKAKGESADL